MKIILIAVSIILCTSLVSHGQLLFSDGFIIAQNNVKKIGKIKQIDCKNIQYLSKYDKLENFSVDNLASYSIDNFKYITGEINMSGKLEKVFMKEVVIGYLSLYEVPKAIETERFVLKKADGSLFVLTEQNASLELRKITYDVNNYKIKTNLISTSFQYTYSNLSNVIADYNYAKKPNIKIKEAKAPFEFGYGLILGLSSNTIIPKSAPTNAYYNTNIRLLPSAFIPFGVFVTISPQKTFSLDLELYYNQADGIKTIQYASSSQKYTDIIHFSEKTISFPVQLKFLFIQKPFVAYIKAGPKAIIEKHVDGYVERASANVPLFTKSERTAVGFSIGLGIEKKLRNSVTPKLEYRYSGHSIQESSTKVAESYSHQFILGISLRNKIDRN